MQDSSLVLYNDPGFVDYKSYCLTWYYSSYGDAGLFGEPLSSSQDGSYDDTYYLTYDDYPGRSSLLNGAPDQEYKEIEMPNNDSGPWLGDYTSYFGSYWGESEVYSDKGYEGYGSSIEKEESSLSEGDKYGSYYSYNDDMQPDYGENQWPGYGGFGFGGGSMEDFCEANRDLPYNSSWDNCEKMILCERIFGH